jgi:hypothetical protein
MIDGHEVSHGAVLPHHRASRIDTPHLVRKLGRDGLSLAPMPKHPLCAAGGQELGPPHEPLDGVSRITHNMSLVMVTENSLPRLNGR